MQQSHNTVESSDLFQKSSPAERDWLQVDYALNYINTDAQADASRQSLNQKAG